MHYLNEEQNWTVVKNKKRLTSLAQTPFDSNKYFQHNLFTSPNSNMQNRNSLGKFWQYNSCYSSAPLAKVAKLKAAADNLGENINDFFVLYLEKMS